MSHTSFVIHESEANAVCGASSVPQFSHKGSIGLFYLQAAIDRSQCLFCSACDESGKCGTVFYQ